MMIVDFSFSTFFLQAGRQGGVNHRHNHVALFLFLVYAQLYTIDNIEEYIHTHAQIDITTILLVKSW